MTSSFVNCAPGWRRTHPRARQRRDDSSACEVQVISPIHSTAPFGTGPGDYAMRSSPRPTSSGVVGVLVAPPTRTSLHHRSALEPEVEHLPVDCGLPTVSLEHPTGQDGVQWRSAVRSTPRRGSGRPSERRALPPRTYRVQTAYAVPPCGYPDVRYSATIQPPPGEPSRALAG
jgi:hypothetical protein